MKSFFNLFVIVLVLGGAWFFYNQLSPAHLLSRIYAENWTDEFHSYATKISGEQSLHVARLTRIESYERTSTANLLGFSLPDVVVGLEFPVEYNYKVSLIANWRFEREAGVLKVYAPELSGMTPAVKISAMKFQVKKDSFLRNEESVKDALNKDLSGFLSENSVRLREQVRPEARKAVEKFVRNWVVSRWGGDYESILIKVLFPHDLQLSQETSSDPKKF